jgi:hypothetical protein
MVNHRFGCHPSSVPGQLPPGRSIWDLVDTKRTAPCRRPGGGEETRWLMSTHCSLR